MPQYEHDWMETLHEGIGKCTRCGLWQDYAQYSNCSVPPEGFAEANAEANAEASAESQQPKTFAESFDAALSGSVFDRIDRKFRK